MELTFQAIIYEVKTTRDGGVRLQLDIGKNDEKQSTQLMTLRDKVLQVGIVSQDEFSGDTIE